MLTRFARCVLASRSRTCPPPWLSPRPNQSGDQHPSNTEAGRSARPGKPHRASGTSRPALRPRSSPRWHTHQILSSASPRRCVDEAQDPIHPGQSQTSLVGSDYGNPDIVGPTATIAPWHRGPDQLPLARRPHGRAPSRCRSRALAEYGPNPQASDARSTRPNGI